ncbi:MULTISPECIES: DUF397 domain-containing protein [unclassified Saccharopolyspora]|uniref:DUF397 domain-containing protein n=1 Tax=unclassified Saccharopolyspora TaxID=2646250 RepID=UPI001CD429D4|nr:MULTISPECIES: DUF397 domain-containing protein [unclassified Saccharopolyspora]MCA1189233.1 DUF397 domain-containing protein [Saccharopolyspora sp. 6T]MCA1192738.1 DUF397 domain-containing protein [Saccharopolyspora sp. 6V]MCA1225355.1 DUF397 domain-containing protein [Saccharopolyspora sp. 6M]MCA1279496.1 DUF397 domain-containing protein [Saccharopolyspora sp. 7B]
MRCGRHVPSSTCLRGTAWRRSSYSGPNGGQCIEVGAVEPESAAWAKSSYSGPNGGDCVEVAALSATAWRKSSRSGQGGGQCVEVASVRSAVGVRDSKDPHGPALLFERSTWAAFVRGL